MAYNSHGHTPAAWTTVSIVFLAFVVGAIAVAAQNWPLFWIGGVGLLVVGGNRAMVEPLARAAMAIGIDGLFFETHPDPDKSPSDGPNMVPLADVRSLLERLLMIRATVQSFH